MRKNLSLTIASLLTIVLFTLHIADDTIHAKEGMDATGTLITVAIGVVFLWATVELAGRRLGYLLMLLGGLASAYMPFLHTMGPRATRWGFEFIWAMFAMAVSGIYVALLAGRELWRSFRRAEA
jgi:hypothetical protein